MNCPKCGSPGILLDKRWICSNVKCDWQSKKR